MDLIMFCFNELHCVCVNYCLCHLKTRVKPLKRDDIWFGINYLYIDIISILALFLKLTDYIYAFHSLAKGITMVDVELL